MAAVPPHNKLFAAYFTLMLHCEFSSRLTTIGLLAVTAYYSSYAAHCKIAF